jgi:hypothetical protein
MNEEKTESICDHYFEWGYTLAWTIYCTKCDKEWFQLGIDPLTIKTHNVIDGKFKERKNEKQGLFSRWFKF